MSFNKVGIFLIPIFYVGIDKIFILISDII